MTERELLQEAHNVLTRYWFSGENNDYNNDDIIAIDEKIMDYLASSKIMFVEELGCAYRWSKEYQQLEWCPLLKGNILDPDEWGYIEEDLVGDEQVTYQGKEATLSEVYRDVESKLKGGR